MSANLDGDKAKFFSSINIPKKRKREDVGFVCFSTDSKPLKPVFSVYMFHVGTSVCKNSWLATQSLNWKWCLLPLNWDSSSLDKTLVFMLFLFRVYDNLSQTDFFPSEIIIVLSPINEPLLFKKEKEFDFIVSWISVLCQCQILQVISIDALP